MGKFSGVLLCSDFDGTLAHAGGVSDANQEAIRYFVANGGRFTLATGRFPNVLEDKGLPNLNNAPIIAMNGTLLYDTEQKKILRCGTLTEAFTDPLLRFCREADGLVDVSIYPSDCWEIVKTASDQETQIIQTMHRKPYKVVFRVERDRSDTLKEQLMQICGDGYAVARSWVTGIEVQDAAYDKGKTARYLADLLGVDTLICVGDYENDLAMIREADLGVAMDNAVEVLKQAADRITASVNEDGVAQLIYSL